MGTIDALVEQFETRKLSRRDLVATLTALVAGGASASPAAQSSAAAQTSPAAQPSPAAQAGTINHVSLAVTDVERSADFYSRLLGLKVVSRPGNGGINLGLGSGFLGLYKLPDPGHVNHFCLGVENYDAERIAAKLQELGIRATVDRNPANRTSGGDQLYFTDPDNTRVQLAANGYQG
jgi:catechol 2,3-dioxygenase-like lactoylglutathione lyase family enzyme